MNETSRGAIGPLGGGPPGSGPTTSTKGDPPIGGFLSPPSSTESDIFGGTGTAPGLPSLGTPSSLGTEFDSFGDSLNLTRLLAGDTAAWDFNDPANAAANAAAANQGSYRPWEVDLAATSSAAPQASSATSTYTTTTLLGQPQGAPPNVLAPGSSALPRPYFQHHPRSSAPTYIDQRLPSFQSQFQESVAAQHHAAAAAAFHPPTPHGAAPPHYHASLVAPHHAHAAAAAAAVHQQQAVGHPHAHHHQSHQFLDHHQQALHSGYHPTVGHTAPPPPGLPHPRPHFPQTASRLHSHLTSGFNSLHHQNKKHGGLADTTRSPHCPPPGQTDLHAASTHSMLTAAEAAHPTLAAQLRKKVRTSSLEGSDMSGSDHSSTDHAPGQVAAISSTDGVVGAFKSPSVHHGGHGAGHTPRGPGGGGGGNRKGPKGPKVSRGSIGTTTTTTGIEQSPNSGSDKKKKRKRCGECTGCQRKDNCGECAPCRNDKSHQICKMRRCERLTEKKPKVPSGNGQANGATNTKTGKPRGRGAAKANKDSTSTGTNASVGSGDQSTSHDTSSRTDTPGAGSATAAAAATTTLLPEAASGTDTTKMDTSSNDLGVNKNNVVSPTSEPAAAAVNSFPYNPTSKPPPSSWATSTPAATPSAAAVSAAAAAAAAAWNTAASAGAAAAYPPQTYGAQPGFGGSYDPQFGALTNNHNSYSRAATSGNSAFGMYGGGGGGGAGNPGNSSHHLAGNSPPGYHTPRPLSGAPLPPQQQLRQPQSSSLSSDSSSATDRYSGHLQRTALHPPHPPDPSNPSPDTTTKDTAPSISTAAQQPQQSFLAYSAGGAPPTTTTVQGNNNLGTTVTLDGTPSAPIKAETTEAAATATPNNNPLTHRHSIHLQQQELASGGQRKSYSEGHDDDDPTAAASATSPIKSQLSPGPNVSRGSGGPPGTTAGKRISSSEEDVLIEKCSQRLLTEAPECRCNEQEQDVKENGPYYVHLGKASSLAELRKTFEARCGVTGSALRIEKARYVQKEGRTEAGCPMAKYIVRRSGPEEKYMVIAKRRAGHTCAQTWTVIAVIAWEGVASASADTSYSFLSNKLSKHGMPVARQCDSNSTKNCACQGMGEEDSGASFTYGCSWSMYNNACKFAKSQTDDVRKFKLDNKDEEPGLEDHFHNLADEISPLYERLVPHAYQNMTAYEEVASACRVGRNKGKPFSGITAVMDFCAHAHRDRHNMHAGLTAILTLTRPENRGVKRPEDEQLHVLPHYSIDNTDEFGSQEGQQLKVQQGSVDVLKKFERMLSKKRVSKKCAKKGKHPTGDRKRFLDSYGKKMKRQSESGSSPQEGKASPRKAAVALKHTKSEPPPKPVPSSAGSQQQPPSSSPFSRPQLVHSPSFPSPLSQPVTPVRALSMPVASSPAAQPQQSSPLMQSSPLSLYSPVAGGNSSFGTFQTPSAVVDNRRGRGRPKGSKNKSSKEEKQQPTGSHPPQPQLQQQQQWPAQPSTVYHPGYHQQLYQQPQLFSQPQQVVVAQPLNAYANPAAASYGQQQQQQYSMQTAYLQQPQQQQTVGSSMWNMELNKDLNGLLQDYEHATGDSSRQQQSQQQQQQMLPPSGVMFPNAQWNIQQMDGHASSEEEPSERKEEQPSEESKEQQACDKREPPKRWDSWRSRTADEDDDLSDDDIPQLDGVADANNGFGQPQQQQQVYNNGYVNSWVAQPVIQQQGYLPQQVSFYQVQQPQQSYIPQQQQYYRQQPSYLATSPQAGMQSSPSTASESPSPTKRVIHSADDSDDLLQAVQADDPSAAAAQDDVEYKYSECKEAFADPQVGGLAISLPHGSVVFECARQELHATTALKEPNRERPTRIGLVFYQHKSLHYAHHGHNFSQAQSRLKNLRDYDAWKAGKFVPTERKLQQMRADGFKFPPNVKTVPPGTNLSFDEIEKPDLSFLTSDDEDSSFSKGAVPQTPPPLMTQQVLQRSPEAPFHGFPETSLPRSSSGGGAGFMGVGGPDAFRGFNPPVKKEEVKTEDDVTPPFPSSWQTTQPLPVVKNEIKPDPNAVKDEIIPPSS